MPFLQTLAPTLAQTLALTFAQTLALTPTLALFVLASCAGDEARPNPERGADPESLPTILLITLDTTRADHLGVESGGDATPTLDALAARGIRFTRAHATAPMTLPSHASMLTGLMPAAHGSHENSRPLSSSPPVFAERLRTVGYQTAAFVSGFPLHRQFGTARGFDHYDDHLPEGGVERNAVDTTDAALGWLAATGPGPALIWVHYFDPHEPYEPREPFRGRYPDDPYLAEIAATDAEVGRLVGAFEDRFADRTRRILVTADHGEGRGEHGETYHGNLLYQGVMRVPLLIAGNGVASAVREDPVSVRQVFATLLSWAGLEAEGGLLQVPAASQVVTAEAMKPFLQYGWQPQAMAVGERYKLIRSSWNADDDNAGDSSVELYDLDDDPGEQTDLAATEEGASELPSDLLDAVDRYPLPDSSGGDAEGDGGEQLDAEARRNLAALGYVPGEGAAPARPEAPSARSMSHLFGDLDRGSGLFVRGRYREAIPLFERVAREDPENLMVQLRLAVAHSVLGEERRALERFERARGLAPGSPDVRHYLGMHHLRRGDAASAAELFEQVLDDQPRRLTTLRALAQVRAGQGRTAEAVDLLADVTVIAPEAVDLVRLGELSMALARTPEAIAAFEQARQLAPGAFDRHLELGVLYMAARRLEEASSSLERVPADHPGSPMALFKRAQVSVLLDEPDRRQRIAAAEAAADAVTRPLIEREPLFRDGR